MANWWDEAQQTKASALPKPPDGAFAPIDLSPPVVHDYDALYTQRRQQVAPALPAAPAAPSQPVLQKNKPAFDLASASSALWEGATQQLVPGVKSAIAQAYMGLDRPDTQPDWTKRWMAEGRTAQEQAQAKNTELQQLGQTDSTSEAIREAMPSLGFSGVAMLSALPAGLVGTATTGPVGGAVAAGTAAGVAGYRMAGAQFLDDMFSKLETESQQRRGRSLTEQEKQQAYEALLPVAQNTGLWEAGPEAVGNAAMFGLGRVALGLMPKEALKSIAKNTLGRVGIRTAAGTTALGTEVATEGVTQFHQGNDQQRGQAAVEALLSGQNPAAAMAAVPPQYQGLEGLVQATKDVAPATLATVLMMGAVAKPLHSAYSSVQNRRAGDARVDAATQATADLRTSLDLARDEDLTQALSGLEAIAAQGRLPKAAAARLDAARQQLQDELTLRTSPEALAEPLNTARGQAGYLGLAQRASELSDAQLADVINRPLPENALPEFAAAQRQYQAEATQRAQLNDAVQHFEKNPDAVAGVAGVLSGIAGGEPLAKGDYAGSADYTISKLSDDTLTRYLRAGQVLVQQHGETLGKQKADVERAVSLLEQEAQRRATGERRDPETLRLADIANRLLSLPDKQLEKKLKGLPAETLERLAAGLEPRAQLEPQAATRANWLRERAAQLRQQASQARDEAVRQGRDWRFPDTAPSGAATVTDDQGDVWTMDSLGQWMRQSSEVLDSGLADPALQQRVLPAPPQQSLLSAEVAQLNQQARPVAPVPALPAPPSNIIQMQRGQEIILNPNAPTGNRSTVMPEEQQRLQDFLRRAQRSALPAPVATTEPTPPLPQLPAPAPTPPGQSVPSWTQPSALPWWEQAQQQPPQQPQQPSVPNAQQIPEAGPTDGRSSARSKVRQEGGRPAQRGQGIQSGRPESGSAEKGYEEQTQVAPTTNAAPTENDFATRWNSATTEQKRIFLLRSGHSANFATRKSSEWTNWSDIPDIDRPSAAKNRLRSWFVQNSQPSSSETNAALAPQEPSVELPARPTGAGEVRTGTEPTGLIDQAKAELASNVSSGRTGEERAPISAASTQPESANAKRQAEAETETLLKPEPPASTGATQEKSTPTPLPNTVKTRNAVAQARNNINLIRQLYAKESVKQSVARKRAMESAYAALVGNARTLGIEVPKLGTYYKPAEYLAAVDAVEPNIPELNTVNAKPKREKITPEQPVSQAERQQRQETAIKEGAKDRRREVLQNRIRLNETVPDKLLTEFADEDWVKAYKNEAPTLSPSTLTHYRDTAGWQEKGGQLLRDESGKGTGRTKWIARDEWWRMYKEAGKGTLTEKDAKAQLQQAIDGKPLSAAGKRLLEFLHEYEQERNRPLEADDWLLDSVDLDRAGFDDLGAAERRTAQLQAEASRDLGEEIADTIFERVSRQHEQSTPEQFNAALEEAFNAVRPRESETGRQQAGEPGPQPAQNVERPLLENYTLDELRAEEARVAKAQAEQAAQEKAANQKAEADRARSNFVLSGSNRPADVAMARGQEDLLTDQNGKPRQSLPSEQPTQPATRATAKSLRDNIDEKAVNSLYDFAKENNWIVKSVGKHDFSIADINAPSGTYYVIHRSGSTGLFKISKAPIISESELRLRSTRLEKIEGLRLKINELLDGINERITSEYAKVNSEYSPRQSIPDETPTQPATIAQARAQLDSGLGKETVKNLEESGRLVFHEQDPTGMGSAGFVDKEGVIHLIPSNMDRDALSVVAHEGVHVGVDLGQFNRADAAQVRVAHAALSVLGLREFIGSPSFNDLSQQVRRMVAEGQKDAIAALAKAKEAAPHNVDEESLAYLAQYAPANLPIVKRILSAVRAALYRMGVKVRLKPEDVRRLAISALKQQAQLAKQKAQRLRALEQAEQHYQAQYGYEALYARKVQVLRNTPDDVTWQRLEIDLLKALKQGDRGTQASQPGIEVGEASWEEFQAILKRQQAAPKLGTPAFQRWFGDGVEGINARNGQPLKLYHGTNEAPFYHFEAAKSGEASKHPTSGLGFFLTADQFSAARYGDRLLEFYAKVNNPYYLTNADLMGIESIADARRLQIRLRNKGYDAAVVTAPGASPYVILFDSKQAKFTTTENPTESIDFRSSISSDNLLLDNETPVLPMLDNGSAMLQHLVKNGSTPEIRAIAEKIIPFVRNAPIRYIDAGQLASLPARIALHLSRSNGITVANTETGEVTIYLRPDFKLGRREATVVHELLHAATMGALRKNSNIRGELNSIRTRLLNTLGTDRGVYPISDPLRKSVHKYFKAALTDADELLAYTFASHDFQALLSQIGADGRWLGEYRTPEERAAIDRNAGYRPKNTQLVPTRSLWQWLVDTISRLFGLPAKYKASIEAIIANNAAIEAENYRRKSPDFRMIKPEIEALLNRLLDSSESNQHIRYSLPGRPPSPSNAIPPAETPVQAGQRAIQDRFVRFQVVQNWLKGTGLNLTPAADVYGAEALLPKKTAARTEDAREQALKPLVQQAAKFNWRLSQGDLIGAIADNQPLPAKFQPSISEYLYARHAPERNQQIAKINPNFPDGGSGLTNQQAADILSRYRAMPNFATFERLANRFQGITQQTKFLLLQSGIISPEMAKAWDASYQHYVPLKGGPEDKAQKTGTGQGISVAGKQQRALGHTLRDENVIENIWRDHERAIYLSEKQQVGKALKALLEQAHNPNIGTVGQPEKRAVLHQGWYHQVWIDGAPLGVFPSYTEAKAAIAADSQLTGRPVSRYGVRHQAADPSVIYTSKPLLGDNEVAYYENGKLIRLQLNDDLLARAAKNLGVDAANGLLKAGQAFNRWLSHAYTGYNPEFLLTNVARDFTTGFINLTGHYGAGMAIKALRNYPKAVAALWRSVRGQSDPLVERYRQAGGSTGAAYLSDLERIGTDLRRTFQDYQGARATWQSGQKGAALRVATTDLVRLVGRYIENLNRIGENALRVSTFQTLLDAGKSEQEAARAAGDVTVNFNRKGELTSTLGGLYLFFNPSVQGTKAMFDALTRGAHRSQAQALTGGLVALAWTLAELARGGDDDDEKRWRRLSSYVKDRNLILRLGPNSDQWLTLPVPYGYGTFWGLGVLLSDLAHGEDKDTAGIRLASTLFEQFSPVGNPLAGDQMDSRNIVAVLPTALKPPVAVALNRNELGRPLMPEVQSWNSAQPDSQRRWRSTQGSMYDRIASGLNALTGGTPYQAGAVDISPETLRYLTRTFAGGAGQFAADTLGLGVVIGQGAGSATEPREWPVVRRFVRADSIQDARTLFAEQSSAVRQATEAFAAAKRARDVSGMRAIVADQRELLSLGKLLEQSRKAVRNRRELEDQINRADLPLAAKRRQLKEIERQEEMVYSRFYDLFEQAQTQRRARED